MMHSCLLDQRSDPIDTPIPTAEGRAPNAMDSLLAIAPVKRGENGRFLGTQVSDVADLRFICKVEEKLEALKDKMHRELQATLLDIEESVKSFPDLIKHEHVKCDRERVRCFLM
mmetsp:Transcript_42763/g.134748  ORF Transcript_42763/g.134748 Transcript_42763/m.134748 type:complete len:114 (-) Transcript_42763:178-519(-)